MKKLVVIVLSLVSIFISQVQAKNFQVQLLTSGENGATMVMSPGYLKIAPGDTVTFLPSDVTHNVESVAIPASADAFNSKMGQNFSLTFTEQGVYLYKCTPHFALGMLGVIQVGNASNLAQIQNKWQAVSVGVALNKERISQYLSQVE